MRLRDGLLIGLIVINMGLFAAFAAWTGMQIRRGDQASERRLVIAVVAVFIVLTSGAIFRLALQMVRLEWIDRSQIQGLLKWWESGQAVAATAVGLYAFLALRAEARLVRRSEHMVAVITTRASAFSRMRQFQLTSREREALEVIRSGTLDDDGIGSRLGVTPATAATHVRNIMRKTGLSDRRDLAVFDVDAGSSEERE